MELTRDTNKKLRITMHQKTAQEWFNDTTIPLLGELLYATDTQILKIGDGIHYWYQLDEYTGGDTTNQYFEYGLRWKIAETDPTKDERVIRYGGVILPWSITYTRNDIADGTGIHDNPFDKIALFAPQIVTDSKGNKFSAFKKFYVNTSETNEGYQYLWVCEKQINNNYHLPRAFKKWNSSTNALEEYWDFYDIGCYEGSSEASGGTTYLRSVAGAIPIHNVQRKDCNTYAKANNSSTAADLDYERYNITQISELTEMLQPLMAIIYGTHNAQLVYQGNTGAAFTGGLSVGSGMGWDSTNKILYIAIGSDNYTVEKLAEFHKDAVVRVQNSSTASDAAGNSGLCPIIKAEEKVEDTAGTLFTGSVAGQHYWAITLDSTNLTVTPSTSTYLFSRPALTGQTDAIAATSGTLDNSGHESASYGTGGRYSFKVMNIENVYGNIWKHVLDCSIGSYYPYLLKDVDTNVNIDDASTLNTTNYERANYTVLQTSNQYIKTINWSAQLFGAHLPTAGSSASDIDYGDYYWISSGNRTALFGGPLRHGTYAGLFSWSLLNDLGSSYWNHGARLSRRRKQRPEA